MLSNYLALAISVPVAFVLGAIWNSPPVFGDVRASLLHGDAAIAAQKPPSPSVLLAEVIRCLLLAVTIGVFINWLHINSVLGALSFGLLAWFGFQAVLISGGLLWENMPARLYAIHVGDALQKMIVVSLLFALI